MLTERPATVWASGAAASTRAGEILNFSVAWALRPSLATPTTVSVFSPWRSPSSGASAAMRVLPM
jgi:hypothetical protein